MQISSSVKLQTAVLNCSYLVQLLHMHDVAYKQASRLVTTYWWLWRSWDNVFVSYQQSGAPPSGTEHLQSFPMLEDWHFGGRKQAFHLCNDWHHEDVPAQFWLGHGTPHPTLFQGNTILWQDLVHSTTPSEWVGLWLLKKQGSTVYRIKWSH